MQIEVQRKRFTVDEFHRMGDIGILKAGDRVELIEGEVLKMTPIGNRHLGCVNAGVHEVWIENLEENVLLVYRDVTEAGYETQLSLPRSATVSPEAFPDVILQVEELLG